MSEETIKKLEEVLKEREETAHAFALWSREEEDDLALFWLGYFAGITSTVVVIREITS